MVLYNRLIAQFRDTRFLSDVKSEYPRVEVTQLYSFNRNVVPEKITPLEQGLFNTVLITSGDAESALPENLYERLSNDPSVEYVQYDQELELYATQLAQPAQNNSQWWFSAIRFPQALMPYTITNPVKVAVIDSGIDHAHIDLDTQSFVPAVNRRDFTLLANGANGKEIKPPDPGFTTDHGTHVAGIIAALFNNTHAVGVANRASLMNLRVFPGGSESAACRAIRYAVTKKAKIINASWGGELVGANPNFGTAMKQAIDYACSKGVVFVCAAGNHSENTINRIPAKFNNVLTVASVSKPGSSGIYWRTPASNDGAKVVSAPGTKIVSLLAGDLNHMLEESGTSMSTAFVTGLIGRMLDKNPNLITSANPAQDILQYLKFTPVSNSVGHGMIDVAATLANLP